MLQRVANLPERMELARDASAWNILVPSKNKRELANVPNELLNRLPPIFYTDPVNAAIRAMGLEWRQSIASPTIRPMRIGLELAELVVPSPPGILDGEV